MPSINPSGVGVRHANAVTDRGTFHLLASRIIDAICVRPSVIPRVTSAPCGRHVPAQSALAREQHLSQQGRF